MSIEEFGDLMDRNECRKSSYFINDNNYCSCQTAVVGFQVSNGN